MDILSRCFLLFSILISGACSHGSYLWHQGIGQLQLQWGSRPNQALIEDPDFNQEYKDKIILVQQYKRHFEDYWQRDTKRIYNRTTILERPWVTMLVVASPHNRIEPHQECFWLMGCFPYIGFFNEGHAIRHEERLERKDLVTMRRPVYAYSTLGYLEDRILSSFFHYDDRELAELIFHELYHTIFFVKNHVNLNENLANYFSQKMVEQYFNDTQEDREKFSQDRRNQSMIREKIVDLAHQLNERYASLSDPTRNESSALLDEFLEDVFQPEIRSLCKNLGLQVEECWPARQIWNNARFAAFLTYEKEADNLALLHQSLGMIDLRKLQLYIEEKYKQYRKDSSVYESFEDFLFKDLSLDGNRNEIPAHHDSSS